MRKLRQPLDTRLNRRTRCRHSKPRASRVLLELSGRGWLRAQFQPRIPIALLAAPGTAIRSDGRLRQQRRRTNNSSKALVRLPDSTARRVCWVGRERNSRARVDMPRPTRLGIRSVGRHLVAPASKPLDPLNECAIAHLRDKCLDFSDRSLLNPISGCRPVEKTMRREQPDSRVGRIIKLG